MTQQKMAPTVTKTGPSSVTIDLGTLDALVITLPDCGLKIKLWPMKEHIYQEYVQSVPELSKLIPKEGEKYDSKTLLAKASRDQKTVIAIIWSFIRTCIDSVEDYVELRKRIYGVPKDKDAISGVEHITMTDIKELPPASEPFSFNHLSSVMAFAIDHFRPESAPDEG